MIGCISKMWGNAVLKRCISAHKNTTEVTSQQAKLISCVFEYSIAVWEFQNISRDRRKKELTVQKILSRKHMMHSKLTSILYKATHAHFTLTDHSNSGYNKTMTRQSSGFDLIMKQQKPKKKLTRDAQKLQRNFVSRSRCTATTSMPPDSPESSHLTILPSYKDDDTIHHCLHLVSPPLDTASTPRVRKRLLLWVIYPILLGPSNFANITM